MPSCEENASVKTLSNLKNHSSTVTLCQCCRSVSFWCRSRSDFLFWCRSKSVSCPKSKTSLLL